MSLGICLAMSPYSASRVISELLFLSDLSLTHPLFAKRHLILPDVLLLMRMKGLPLLPEKQQPWVCPGNLVLDCVCSFIEACVQKLKSASLTFAAANSTTTSTSSSSSVSASSSSSLSSASKGGGGTSSLGETGDGVNTSVGDGGGGGGGGVSPLTSAAKAVEWMLPQQATIREGGGEEEGGEIRLKQWVSDATVLFTGMLDLKLLDLEAIMTGRTIQDQQIAINHHRLLLQRCAGEGGIGVEDTNTNNYLNMICLYDYLLECRRLELLSSCAYFLNYPRLKVDVILDLLFRRYSQKPVYLSFRLSFYLSILLALYRAMYRQSLCLCLRLYADRPVHLSLVPLSTYLYVRLRFSSKFSWGLTLFVFSSLLLLASYLSQGSRSVLFLRGFFR